MPDFWVMKRVVLQRAPRMRLSVFEKVRIPFSVPGRVTS